MVRISISSLAVFSIALLVILVNYACSNQSSKEEELAKTYCGSCHIYPEPSLLDKGTWKKSVLPQMAFRMGFPDMSIMSQFTINDLEVVNQIIPAQPMISTEEWMMIRNFYLSHAPDSLQLPELSIKDTLMHFNIEMLHSIDTPLVTMVKIDASSHNIYIGDRLSNLYILNDKFSVVDSYQLDSPPSYIIPAPENIILSLMGIMDPNDQAKGQLISMHNMKPTTIIVDSLKRPVHFQTANLNNDGLDSYVICEFGNYTGYLSVYETTVSNKIKKHILSESPGLRKVVVQDFNGDHLNDILALMTQGDERLVLYLNKGNFNFDEKVLLRFPPVYGFNYFEIADFNHDGHVDILTTNGDNADYSIILKPYHAVRIFENDGRNNFKEIWSHPMPGASQAVARDFDKDGDIDIAAISFFPDFDNFPEQGFIYFENTGANQYLPRTDKKTDVGRWLVMDAEDYDNDGDCDIILGALNFNGLGANPKIFRHWAKNNIPLLLLKNDLN